MADKKTSEKYIAPPKYEFTDPKDIEGGCKCDENEKSPGWFKCAGDGCAKAGGACRLVVQAPDDPQLRLLTEKKAGDEKTSDDKETFWRQGTPGWSIFCVCLKYTGKEPTDEDKKKWPALPKWEVPGFKGVGKLCGQPEYSGGKWRCNGKDCYLVGIEKQGDTKLKKLADPGHGVHENVTKGYFGLFCAHLES